MASQTPVILREADFRKELRSDPAPGYLLFGEEDYLKAIALRQAREALGGDPSFACFNEILLDGLDFTPEKLKRALLPLPMMAERKVIVLRGLNFVSMRPSDLEGLCRVLAELPDNPHNVLLVSVAAGAIEEGYLPKRPSAILCRLGEFLTPVQFERCSPQKLNGWCIRHFTHNGVEATPALCDVLIAHCGRTMSVLANEIDKVSYYLLAHGRSTLREEDIREATSSSTEYDAFAFANAIMEHDLPTALEVLADLKFRRTEPLLLLSEVIRTVCDMRNVRRLTQEGRAAADIASLLRLHAFKVSLYQKHTATDTDARLEEAMRACIAADQALKQSPSGYGALETLVCSL